MIKQFTYKDPPIINAIQWPGYMTDEIKEFLNDAVGTCQYGEKLYFTADLYIAELDVKYDQQFWYSAFPDEWICKDEHGNYWTLSIKNFDYHYKPL